MTILKKILFISIIICFNVKANISEDCQRIEQIGRSGECLNKLIVDNELLAYLVKNERDYSHQSIYTGNVTDMSHLFKNREVKYDITGWDVSNVRDMKEMFYKSENFNQDISKWDVSSVIYMDYMFAYNLMFNYSLLNWNLKSLKNFKEVFFESKISNKNKENFMLKELELIDYEILLKLIQKETQKISKSLPIQINENVTLISSYMIENHIFYIEKLNYDYNYLQEFYKERDFDIKLYRKEFEFDFYNSITNMVCTDKKFKALISRGIIITYKYIFIDMESFLTIDIDQCK